MMLISLAACSGRGQSSSQSSGSEPSSSAGSSGGTVVETPMSISEPLGEKIDAGIVRNADTKGWLYIPNTTIDDSVLQAADNEYYLRLTEDKKYDIFGCYFADYECTLKTRDKMSKNTIIYGHSDLKDNKDGKKFSQLYHYTDIEFVKNNPYIFFSTVEEDMTWKVFAVFYTNISFNYIPADPNTTVFNDIISEAKQRSLYIISDEVKDGDKILTLSTCSAYYNKSDPDNYRLVVMARLVGANENTPATMEVPPTPNPNMA
jgi:sortase B